MSIASVMPSSHLSFCPQSFPASRTFPISQLFASGDQNTGASASASVLLVLKIDWFDLLSVQTSFRSLVQHHSSKASILWHSAFFTVQLSQPYVSTGKTIALTTWTFVGRVMSLLFNTLSVCHHFPAKKQSSFDFMAAVTVHSDFGAQ